MIGVVGIIYIYANYTCMPPYEEILQIRERCNFGEMCLLEVSGEQWYKDYDIAEMIY